MCRYPNLRADAMIARRLPFRSVADQGRATSVALLVGSLCGFDARAKQMHQFYAFFEDLAVDTDWRRFALFQPSLHLGSHLWCQWDAVRNHLAILSLRNAHLMSDFSLTHSSGLPHIFHFCYQVAHCRRGLFRVYAFYAF